MYFLFMFFRDVTLLVAGSCSARQGVERSLAWRSGAELLKLRDGAFELAKLIEEEYLARAIAVDVTPECDTDGCVLERAHGGDHSFDLSL